MVNADNSVRPALVADAPAIARAQLEQMVAAAEAGLAEPLGAQRDVLDPATIEDSWRQAITAPPSAKHHVLSALCGRRVVGFAALAPAASGAPSGPLAERPADAEIVALAVLTDQRGQGHEDRLLNAVGDILRRTGAARAQVWVTVGDDWLTRLLTESGFGPAGLRRDLAVGKRKLTQQLWYTDFQL